MPKLINPGHRDVTITWTENGVRKTVTISPFHSRFPRRNGEVTEVDIPEKHAQHYLTSGSLCLAPVEDVIVEEPKAATVPPPPVYAATADEDDTDTQESDIKLADRESIAKEETAKVELTAEQKRKLEPKALRLANLARGRAAKKETTKATPKDPLVEETEDDGEDSGDAPDESLDQKILAAHLKPAEPDLEPTEDVAPAPVRKKRRFEP